MIEGRRDNNIVFRILKSLQTEILKRNIYDIYKMFLEQYGDNYIDDIFGHVTFYNYLIDQ